MKKYCIFLLMASLAFGAQAQRKKKKEETNTVTSTPKTLQRPGQPTETQSSGSQATTNPNLLPLYGGQTRSAEQQKADQAFLADCDRNFSSREEASKFFETRAWEYLQEGKLDTATYRFNLAWLLDNKNVNTYWGLGSIVASRGKNAEAIELLEKGLAIEPNNSPLMVDLATLHLNNYEAKKEKKEKKELQATKEILERAIQADTANATAFHKLSMVYYYEENYDKAWEYLHKGRARAVGGLDFAYLTELMAKKEDPMGVFKQSVDSTGVK